MEAELPKLPKMLQLFAMDLVLRENGLMREGHKPQTVTALLTSFEQHSIRIEGWRFFVRRGIALAVAHDNRARQLEASRPAVSASWALLGKAEGDKREKEKAERREKNRPIEAELEDINRAE